MTRASERAWLLTTALHSETPGAVPGSGAIWPVCSSEPRTFIRFLERGALPLAGSKFIAE